MKVFTLLISLLLSFNVFASTSDLSALIDEHQFFLTVDWDQKDQAALELKEKEFGQKFADIAQREKLTQEDVLKVIEQKIHSPELVKRLRNLKPGPEALKDFLNESRANLYSQGASWNGDATVVGITLALVILTVGAAYLAITSRKNVDCHYDPNSYGCKTPENGACTQYGQEWRCSTSNYTDLYGQTRTQESCGYYEVCVAH